MPESHAIPITVGMPTYNAEKTIRRAIDSVINQEFSDWQLLLSDDFSSDSTREIINEYTLKYPEKILIRHPPIKLYYLNFRHILFSADSKYFVWLAGDDWWEPGFLGRCFERLRRDPDAVCCLARCRFHTADGGSHIDLDARAIFGDRTTRIANYLLNPDQTRMYGLFKRDVLTNSFPDRAFHAYDWALCAGTLRFGPHVDVDEVLMNRDRTPSEKYMELVDHDEPNVVLKFFPVWRMTIFSLRKGLVPSHRKTISALIFLNISKNRQQIIRRWPRIARILSPIYRAVRWASRRSAHS